MKTPAFIKAFASFRMFVILLMGISSGLPLALTGGTLQAWMRNEGVDLGTIGLFALVGLPYTFKFVWAPLMDRFSFGILGRRRDWMLISQVFLVLAILMMGFTNPKENLTMVAALAVAVAFFSASQDIVLDAWRREALDDAELGLGSSIHVAGYLFAFRMISGALALILADLMPWNQVFMIMAAIASVGIFATFFCKEPKQDLPTPKSLKEAVVDPFVEFFSRSGAVPILIFILLYKVGDNMASQMSIPLYLDIGFTKTEVGAISKVVGWISLATGGILGGAVMVRLGIYRSLIWFGILQGISNFGFAILQWLGKDLTALTSVIAFENFTAGMGTSAFVAFMATLTNKRFTATQYALLTSFMGVPRTFMAAPTGFMAESMGYFWFFTFCTLIALPGIMMIPYMRKLQQH